MLTPGIYQHFKGNLYKVLGTAKHSENEHLFVVYEALYPCEQKLWVRPLEMFTGTVLKDGVEVPRFRKIEDGTESK